MDQITSILNTIIGDPLYIIIAIAFLVLIFFGVIKKLFKLTVIVILCTILYLAFIYFTKGPEEAAIEVDKIGNTIENIPCTVKEKIDSFKSP